MPSLLVINPNSSVSVSDNLRLTITPPPGTNLEFYTAPPNAPKEISGTETSIQSEEAALPDILEKRLLDSYDGFLVACYSDHPLVASLAQHTDKPVLGIMQATLLYSYANARVRRSFVLTSTSGWLPLLDEAITKFAGSGEFPFERFQKSRALDVSVLDLSDASEFSKITERVSAFLREYASDNIDCVLLGVLDEELASNIRSLLPPRLQLYSEWELLYSLEQHGISLNSLYRNCRPETQKHNLNVRKARANGDTGGFAEGVVKNMVTFGENPHARGSRPHGYIVVIQDEHKNKFGCYLNEHPRPSEHKRYYGNGECFLWKTEWYNAPQEPKRRRDRRFKAFPYTGLNDNLIYSNVDFIAVGSSRGNNGLYIDKSLYSGVSYPCETFGNEILCDHEIGAEYGSFKIMNLEVWRVGELE
ncbi:hypothetical protein CA3LBN_003688 [Candidozyma haemuli]|uniref:Oxidation resistance protein 1 n=1 Tax=Candidozyma haemuli TaxID=45357 RepID=A0ABX8I9I7_9ASCO|nr:hypothetical protein CA3LBN_003688 [[Candida] haemuloni]